MKNKIWFALNLITLAAVVFFAFGERGNAQKQDNWDYKVVPFSFKDSDNPENELDYHGSNGWELVTINELSSQRNSILVFKRKK